MNVGGEKIKIGRMCANLQLNLIIWRIFGRFFFFLIAVFNLCEIGMNYSRNAPASVPRG